MDRYYVKVSGATGSLVPHDTLAKAYIEARRLFDLRGRSRRVYVLQVVGALDPETQEQSKRDPVGTPACPSCKLRLYRHERIAIYRCRNAECQEFDRWATVRGGDHA